MGSKNRKSIFNFFQQKKEKGKFPFHKYCTQWLHLGHSGYRTEALVGTSSCQHCRRKQFNIYRGWSSEKGDDVLRFEQQIENGTGRVTISVPISIEWQKMHSRMEKEYVREKLNGEKSGRKIDGKLLDYIRKDFFATLECIECKGKMDTFLAIAKLDGEERFRWYLCCFKQRTLKFCDENIVFDEKKGLL
jgi:hypothetical protein